MLLPNRTNSFVLTVVVLLTVGLIKGGLLPDTVQAESGATSAVEFTADGKAKPPVGYRKWVFVGSPVTPRDMNAGDSSISEFHSVYMDPASFAVYEKTGKFPDGTVLVKELINAQAEKESPSGRGYYPGEFNGLEFSVKDSKRFKDEPGNWAYFFFGDKLPTEALQAEAIKKPAAACNRCHQDNAKTDWVYSQYYPVLRAAAASGK